MNNYQVLFRKRLLRMLKIELQMNRALDDEYEPNHPNNQSKKQVPLGRTCVSSQAYNVFLKPKAAKVYGHIVELTDLGRTQNKLSYYRSFH